MIGGWLRRRRDRLVDDALLALDPNACPECMGEGFVTVPDPEYGEVPEICWRCHGTGKRKADDD